MSLQTISMTPTRTSNAGFSLIELMVAMVLGLIVLGAAISVFQSNLRTYQANGGLNRVQEGSRVAFELISRDLRAAGGSACSSASVIETTGALSDSYQNTPVTGTASELTVTSGEDSAYKVTASSPTSVTLDIPDATVAFAKDDWVLLCNARKTFLIQATAVSGPKVTFAALPGGYDPTADTFAPPAAVVLAKVRNARWYVAANPRGGSSLYVSRLGAAGEEVAEGVQSLALTYLRSGAAAYGAAPAPADPAWRDVIAVRMDMAMQGQNVSGSTVRVDGKTINRTASTVVSLRGRTL